MAKLVNLIFKRNVNVFINGNPSSVWPHVLQTRNLGKVPSGSVDNALQLESGDYLTTESDDNLSME
jgi:hypothetical protein